MATDPTMDSNRTGLRFAEETSLKTLPVNPVWFALEPNTYSDFGGQITTVARNPINPSRQQKKGVTTDLNASGSFNQDLTFSNTTRLLQGFFFADIREKTTTAPMNGTAVTVESAAAGVVTLSGPVAFAVGDLVGYGTNNAVSSSPLPVTAVTGDTVTITGVPDQTFPAGTFLKKVGFTAAGKLAAANGLITFAAPDGVDFTQHNLIPGEWVFVAPLGFARISVIAAGLLTFDKVDAALVDQAEVAAIFVGDVLKNESDVDLIKRRSYNIERSLGKDANGEMTEYLVGAVPNELTVNVSQADKVTIDLAFVALDNEQRNGQTGPKTGTRPDLMPEDAYNTSTDFSRIKMSLASDEDASPKALFAFATELKLVVNNNVSANKAIGNLGGIGVNVGTFAVTGTETVYFADIDAVQSIRNNSDVTFDIVLRKGTQGMLFDIPLLSLGDGRLSVTANSPITLPLNITGAENKFGHTLLFQSFPYLPDAA